jgi:hypothetical protein
LRLELAFSEIAFATSALSAGYISPDAALAIHDDALAELEGIGA